MSVERLRSVLGAIGPPPSTLELAEMLWLAAHIGGEPAVREAPAGPSPDPVPFADEDTGVSQDEQPADLTFPPPAPADAHRYGVHLPDEESEPDPDALVREVLVPTAPMLTETLEVQRALRPLKRRVESSRRRVLDENATADRIARTADRDSPWLPVMVPATERWLNLLLIVDSGPSMRMWRPLGRELHETLARTGAFRNVRIARLDGDGVTTAAPGGSRRGASTLIDATGRQVALVLSDCSGPHWWRGRAQRALVRLAAHGPLAVVQPLAERLWSRTAAPTTLGTLYGSRPCAPNPELRFVPFDDDPGPGPSDVPVPVLECSHGWFAEWARVVGGVGGARTAAVAYLGTETPSHEPVDRERRLSVESRVRRFQSSASREAVLLAAHAAVSFPALPIMRLIQRRVLPASQPGHLAEVLLSGLLSPRNSELGVYEFLPGAREALLSALPRSRAWHTAELLKQISREIEQRAGRGADAFRALVMSFDGDEEAAAPASRPFALVSSAAMRMITRTALSRAVPRNPAEARGTTVRATVGAGYSPADGYTLVRVLDESDAVRTWRAVDGTSGEVVIKQIKSPPGQGEADFAALRRRLTELVERSRRTRHPALARYLELVESDGRLWLVMERHEGEPLARRLAEHGPLPWETVARIGGQLVAALIDCREAGLVHGLPTAEDVLLDGDDVTLTGFETRVINVRVPSEPAGHLSPELLDGESVSVTSDLWAVGVTLYEAVEDGSPFGSGPRGGRRRTMRPPRLADRLGPLLERLLHQNPGLRLSPDAALGAFDRLLLGEDGSGESSADESSHEPWITMWGPPGSGKTTFLGALSIATSRSNSSLKVIGADIPSTDRLIDTTAMLTTRRHFPPTTLSLESFRWILVGQSEVRSGFLNRRTTLRSYRMGLNVYDPPGELFLPAETHGPGREQMIENLVRSRGVVYLFDPVREFEVGDAFDSLRDMLLRVSARMDWERSADGPLPHHVAVCVTKFDELRVLRTAVELGLVSVDEDDPHGFPRVRSEEAGELFQQLCAVSASGTADMILPLLRQYFRPDRIRFFVTSAIGFYLDPVTGTFNMDDPQNLIPDDKGRDVRIRGQVRPINVVEPLLWLSRRLDPATRS
ncbi:SAV_2336 N-terminal domain-related protein [Streptosporangium sp. NPDC051022]|uniref:SAV_2336 N-terminal domain-related protein n=1 Tax=Streptosporangium sp. NPDC051022 TaxID=3155752 RepID=UPI003412691A